MLYLLIAERILFTECLDGSSKGDFCATEIVNNYIIARILYIFISSKKNVSLGQKSKWTLPIDRIPHVWHPSQNIIDHPNGPYELLGGSAGGGSENGRA